MTKKVLIAILASLLIVVGLTSCSDAGSGGSADPKRPSSLSVSSFTENYPVGASKPEGTLIYTSTEGKITTVGMNDEGVTTNFNATTAGENKTLIVSYKGIDAAKTYSVYNVPTVLDAEGWFVVDKNTTYEFTSGSNEVLIEKFDSWSDYKNLNASETEEAKYKVKISAGGFVYGKRFNPDGMGGFQYYESDYLDEPEIVPFGSSSNTYYVSEKADNTKSSDTKVNNKYLYVQFVDVSDTADKYEIVMKMWFEDSDNIIPTSVPYIVTADKISFGTSGVFFQDVTIGNTKNLKMHSKNGFEDSISIVSSSEGDYIGYDFILKPVNFV